MLHLGLALGLFGLAGCGADIPHPDPYATPKVPRADYEGTYSCGGDTWKARLIVSGSNDGYVLATANLKSTTVEFKSAIWGLKGTATDAGVLTLTVTDDLEIPQGFKSHGFTGQTNAEGFVGTTTDERCGPITLPRLPTAAPAAP